MILLNDVLAQHKLVTSQSGDADGVRDINVLESAVTRPFQTFGGEDLYPSLFEKAQHYWKALS